MIMTYKMIYVAYQESKYYRCVQDNVPYARNNVPYATREILHLCNSCFMARKPFWGIYCLNLPHKIVVGSFIKLFHYVFKNRTVFSTYISRKMSPKNNTERSKEFRRKRMEEPDFDQDTCRENERDRITKIREMQKLERMFDSGKKAYRLKEKFRKQEMRKKKVLILTKKKNEKLDVQHKRKSREERQKLQLKVKLFSNENRKLQRKVQSPEQVSDDIKSASESEQFRT